MHILIVHQYYLHKNSGGGSRWNQFAKYWSKSGHKITVLAGMLDVITAKKHPEHKGRFIATEYNQSNIIVKRCHVSEAYNRNFIGRAWAYVSFVISSTLAGLLVKKVDIIICTSPPLTVSLTGWILSKLKRIPMVFEVRDLWPESAIDTGVLTNKWLIRMLYWLERKSYSSASRINVLTPAFEKALIEKKGIRPNKISMIPNGADLDIIKPGPADNRVREKYNLNDKFVVTYVGAHGAANALMQLIEAAKILKETDSQVQIMLVGDGMEKTKLLEETKKFKLDNVTFVEPVPKSQIADYINASDVCIAVLKKCDVFKTVYPNKVFDYMAAAKPVLIGIDGAARKLVEDAGAGIFAEPENAQEIANAMRFYLASPKIAQQHGQNGYEFVKRNYDRRVLASKYLQLIEEQVVKSSEMKSPQKSC